MTENIRTRNSRKESEGANCKGEKSAGRERDQRVFDFLFRIRKLVVSKAEGLDLGRNI